MIWLPIALGFGAILGLAILTPATPPPGLAARDVLPPGWSGAPAQTTRVKATSGREYDVFAWKVVNGHDYFAAQLVGDPSNWIGFIRTVASGEKRLFRAAADTPAMRDMMLSDFQVKP